MCQFPLLLIERVQVVDAEFEGSRNVQQIGSAGSQTGSRLPGQPASPLEYLIRQRTQLKKSVRHILLKVFQGSIGLRVRKLFAEDSQLQGVYYFKFAEYRNEVLGAGRLHGADGRCRVRVRAVQRNQEAGIGVGPQ